MFENIKVGDNVLIPIEIKPTIFSKTYKNFLVCYEVTKVTPKQFEARGCMYRKVDGTKVGCRGEEAVVYNPEQDETGACIEYQIKIRSINNFRNRLAKFDRVVFNYDSLAGDISDADKALSEFMEKVEKISDLKGE